MNVGRKCSLPLGHISKLLQRVRSRGRNRVIYMYSDIHVYLCMKREEEKQEDGKRGEGKGR